MAKKKTSLIDAGNNPLLQNDNKPELSEADVQAIKNSWETNQFEVMSTLVRRNYKKLLRDYAYTNRLTLKEAIDKILCDFFNTIDKDKLIERIDLPRKKRGM